MRSIFKPLVFILAAIYFLVDAAFWTVAGPLGRWLGDHWVLDRLRIWIVSLRPYPTLALFLVPVIILEPVKPVAAYLTATGHVVGGLTVLIVGELLKLLLIERLFRINRDKLMSIGAFAWCYDKFLRARGWIESLQAWQLARRLSLIARHAVRSYILEMKKSQKPERLSWQPR